MIYISRTNHTDMTQVPSGRGARTAARRQMKGAVAGPSGLKAVPKAAAKTPPAKAGSKGARGGKAKA